MSILVHNHQLKGFFAILIKLCSSGIEPVRNWTVASLDGGGLAVGCVFECNSRLQLRDEPAVSMRSAVLSLVEDNAQSSAGCSWRCCIPLPLKTRANVTYKHTEY